METRLSSVFVASYPCDLKRMAYTNTECGKASVIETFVYIKEHVYLKVLQI